MPRKPKGWEHRYEIIYDRVKVRENTKHEHQAMRWSIAKYYGRSGAARSFGTVYPSPERDIPDDQLIKRCGLSDVTVPVVVIRRDGVFNA